MDGSYAEILIAFGMVALLGLILRFTFSRELPRGTEEAVFAEPDDDFRLDDLVSQHPASTPAVAQGDDFGLLAPVAVTDGPDEAELLKARLADAGIRATTTRGRDGRYRVLVFASELDRARRVGGTT